MKKKIALLSLGLVSFGFCVDEYQPITPKSTEVDIGYNPVFESGFYDNGSNKQKATGSPMTNNIGAQVKYGIMPNFDVEASWFFQMNNADLMKNLNGPTATSTSGFGGLGYVGPDLAAKYAWAEYGVGVYLDVVFPLVTGDFKTTPSGADFGFAPGVVYGKNFGKFQAVARAQYQLNLQNGDKVKQGDVLWIYLKPGYSITDALAGYVGLNYQMIGKSQFNGNDVGNTGDLIFVNPGATFTQNKMMSYELNVPVTLTGKNQLASWGISAAAYFTFGN